MLDKSLLMFRGGVRSTKKTLADGQEHTLYYKARTPNEIAGFLAADTALSNDEKGTLNRQKSRARFIAESLCDETGDPLMTTAEAEQIPVSLKVEIVALVIEGSSETGEAGKD